MDLRVSASRESFSGDLKHDDLQWTKQHPLNWSSKDWLNWLQSVSIDFNLKDIPMILRRYANVSDQRLIHWTLHNYNNFDPAFGHIFHNSLKLLLQSVFGSMELGMKNEAVEIDEDTKSHFFSSSATPMSARTLLDLTVYMEDTYSSGDFDDLPLESGMTFLPSNLLNEEPDDPMNPSSSFHSCFQQDVLADQDLDSQYMSESENECPPSSSSIRSWGTLFSGSSSSMSSVWSSPKTTEKRVVQQVESKAPAESLNRRNIKSSKKKPEGVSRFNMLFGRKIKQVTSPPTMASPATDLPWLRSSSKSFIKTPETQKPSAKDKQKRPAISRKQGIVLESVNNHLYKFLLDLLAEDGFEDIIEWENRSTGIFQINKPETLAMLWGRKKGNKCMDYEKLSRAIRHYYKSQIIMSVPKRQLVYQFGPQIVSTLKVERCTLRMTRK